MAGLFELHIWMGEGMIEGEKARVLEVRWERSVYPVWCSGCELPVAYEAAKDQRCTLTLRFEGPIPEWLGKIMQSDDKCVRILP